MSSFQLKIFLFISLYSLCYSVHGMPSAKEPLPASQDGQDFLTGSKESPNEEDNLDSFQRAENEEYPYSIMKDEDQAVNPEADMEEWDASKSQTNVEIEEAEERFIRKIADTAIDKQFEYALENKGTIDDKLTTDEKIKLDDLLMKLLPEIPDEEHDESSQPPATPDETQRLKQEFIDIVRKYLPEYND